MQGIRVPFVVVGFIVEPRVSFSLPCINFDQVLLGRRSKLQVDLVNEESIPFQFFFDKATYDASNEIISGRGKPSPVSIEPCSGTIGASSHVTITATYKPVEEVSTNYLVHCNVKQKTSPIPLNIKGEGYVVRESLLLEGPTGEDIPLSATVCFCKHAPLFS
jgi:hydrocephalus-inducing protein